MADCSSDSMISPWSTFFFFFLLSSSPVQKCSVLLRIVAKQNPVSSRAAPLQAGSFSYTPTPRKFGKRERGREREAKCRRSALQFFDPIQPRPATDLTKQPGPAAAQPAFIHAAFPSERPGLSAGTDLFGTALVGLGGGSERRGVCVQEENV